MHDSGRLDAKLTAARALALLLATLLALPGLTGLAAAQQATPAATPSKILRVAQGPYPSSLDPQAGGFINDIAVYTLEYEGLTRLDAKLQTVPAAAERWEFSPDGLTLTFHLRAGLAYSDGSPLTAQRFADAALRTCDPRVNALYASVLFVVEGCQAFHDLGAGGATPVAADALTTARYAVGIEVPDDRTLVIHLTQPASYFPTVASTWVFFPVKQELVDAGGADWAKNAANLVSNGPFTITAIVDQGRITFTANAHYWAGRPKLDGLIYFYGKNAADSFPLYQRGLLDLVGVDPAMLDTIKTDPLLSRQLVTFPQAFTTTFVFNLTKAPFDDKQVREAFAYAFDRDTWCGVLFHGTCNPTLSWIPAGIPGHLDTTAYAYDPDKARAALAQSSYAGKALPPITFTYVAGDPTTDAAIEWLAAQYRQILGVTITPKTVDFQTWSQMSLSPETFPDMTFGGWGQDYPDPQDWLSLVYTCRAAIAQAFGYCNPAFDDLIDQADSELDPAKRLDLYHQATQVFVDDAVSIMVSNGVGIWLVKPNVTGLVPTPSDFGFPGQYASLLTADLTEGSA